MVVCNCHGVNDAHVRALIAEGAADESEIGLRCGAGTDCGACVDELRALCEESRFEESRCSVAESAVARVLAGMAV